MIYILNKGTATVRQFSGREHSEQLTLNSHHQVILLRCYFLQCRMCWLAISMFKNGLSCQTFSNAWDIHDPCHKNKCLNLNLLLKISSAMFFFIHLDHFQHFLLPNQAWTMHLSLPGLWQKMICQCQIQSDGTNVTFLSSFMMIFYKINHHYEFYGSP